MKGTRGAIRLRFLSAIPVLAAIAIFGGCAASTPDEPLSKELGAGTSMGAVELRTADLESLGRFYVQGVGLEVLEDDDGALVLGIDNVPLIELVETDAPADDITEAGLYHSAFLFPDEATLADALARMATVAPESFQGSADHNVSQAFYFGDPEGNGVELYVDRPSADWEWEDGVVTMGSLPLDPNAFLDEHFVNVADRDDSASGVVMGHVHLRGGDVAKAEEFYADTLGFKVTAQSEGAIFFAAGDYHHHMAVNVWSSEGAGDRPETVGLGHVTILVPHEGELAALEARLKHAEREYTREGAELHTTDPWGTEVIVSVRN